MSYGATSSVHSRAISAFFDTTDAAGAAIEDLVAAGIPREHISRDAASGGESHKGFWASLKDAFLPEADRPGYEEGLRRGGTLVTVRADEANYTRVIDILDRDGAVNMDEREKTWRGEGWSGAPQSDTILGFAATGAVIRDPAAADKARVARRDADNERARVRNYLFDSPVDVAPQAAMGDLGQADDLRTADAGRTTSDYASRILPHMDVMAADGEKIGEVDHLDGPDRIKLAKSASPDGRHHVVPFAWIDRVDRHVRLKKTVAEILDAR